MDWPAVESPFLSIPNKGNNNGDNDGFFYYDEPSEFTSTVLRDHEPPLELKSDKEWEEWLKWFRSPVFRDPSESQDRSGYHILLSARARPEQQATPVQHKQEIATGLEHLPFSRARWQKIASAFRLHNVIRKGLERGKCYSTYLVSTAGTEAVEMYTAVMSSEWQSNIAISSTHFRDSKLTLAVIYGCNDKQMDRVTQLINGSPEVKGHPLLMPGVFAELQRDRLDDLVLKIEDELDALNSDLKINRPSVPADSRELTWESSRRLGNFRLRAKKVEEEARTVKGELRKMIERIKKPIGNTERNSTDADSPDPVQEQNFATSRRRFSNRFEEICNELDSMMVRCRDSFEEVTYARELFMAEAARQEAELSRQEAKHAKDEANYTKHQTRTSTVIAFVAMLYLPMTSVATIFAMPVFDFQNRWFDVGFHDTNPTSDNSPNASLSEPKTPVFSAYFWLYLIISVVLTAITLYCWYRWAGTPDIPNSPQDGRGNSGKRSFGELVPEGKGGSTQGIIAAGNGGGSSDADSLKEKLPVAHKWLRDLLSWLPGRRRVDDSIV